MRINFSYETPFIPKGKPVYIEELFETTWANIRFNAVDNLGNHLDWTEGGNVIEYNRTRGHQSFVSPHSDATQIIITATALFGINELVMI